MTKYVNFLHSVVLLVLVSMLAVGWGAHAHAQETPADVQYGSPTERGLEDFPDGPGTGDQGGLAGASRGGSADGADGTEASVEPASASGAPGGGEGGAAGVWGFGVGLLIAFAGVFASLYLVLRVMPGLSLPLHRRALTFLALIGLLVAGTQALLIFADPLPPEPLQLASLAAQAAVPACLLVAGLLLRRSEIEEVGPLRRSADLDPLTVLPNQAFFRRAASRRVALAGRHGVPLSLAMLDIDDFKEYNDLFGHEAGNAVLVRVAGVLRRSARADDLVTRYGGEEFMMLLNSDQKDAEEALERIRSGIEARCSPADAKMSRQVTVSVGVASLAGHPRTLEELIETADEAMYQAKRTGKNRVVGAEEAA